MEVETGKPRWEFWGSIQVSAGDLVAHVFPRKCESSRRSPLYPLSLALPTGNTAHQVPCGCFLSRACAYELSLDGKGQGKAIKSLIWSLCPGTIPAEDGQGWLWFDEKPDWIV